MAQQPMLIYWKDFPFSRKEWGAISAIATLSVLSYLISAIHLLGLMGGMFIAMFFIARTAIYARSFIEIDLVNNTLLSMPSGFLPILRYFRVDLSTCNSIGIDEKGIIFACPVNVFKRLNRIDYPGLNLDELHILLSSPTREGKSIESAYHERPVHGLQYQKQWYR
jgi:hypothetical protein